MRVYWITRSFLCKTRLWLDVSLFFSTFRGTTHLPSGLRYAPPSGRCPGKSTFHLVPRSQRSSMPRWDHPLHPFKPRGIEGGLEVPFPLKRGGLSGSIGPLHPQDSVSEKGRSCQQKHRKGSPSKSPIRPRPPRDPSTIDRRSGTTGNGILCGNGSDVPRWRGQGDPGGIGGVDSSFVPFSVSPDPPYLETEDSPHPRGIRSSRLPDPSFSFERERPSLSNPNEPPDRSGFEPPGKLRSEPLSCP